MSNNLNLDQVSASQTNKEATVNSATGQLDAALTELFSINLTSASVTLTLAEYRSAVRFLITASAASRSVTVQAIKKLSLFDNATANAVSLILGSTTLTMDPNTAYLVYSDGTANGLSAFKLPNVASISEPYDVGTSIVGLTNNNEKIFFFVFTRNATLPASASGSQAKAGTAATAATSYSVKKNGVSIGSIDFAISGTTGSFTGFSATNFVAGDVLSITGPATADATLADVAFTLKMTRTS